MLPLLNQMRNHMALGCVGILIDTVRYCYAHVRIDRKLKIKLGGKVGRAPLFETMATLCRFYASPGGVLCMVWRGDSCL